MKEIVVLAAPTFQLPKLTTETQSRAAKAEMKFQNFVNKPRPLIGYEEDP